MKKILFCSAFMAVILTLVSFTNNYSKTMCNPPTPSSISFFPIMTDCTGDYFAAISYPVGTQGQVSLFGGQPASNQAASLNSNYSVGFRVNRSTIYQLTSGNICGSTTISFTTPGSYPNKACREGAGGPVGL